MEENKEKNQNQDTSQGKQSTAETDVNYSRDDASLRNSTTASMSAASDPESDQVAGGDRVDDLVGGITDDTEADTETDN